MIAAPLMAQLANSLHQLPDTEIEQMIATAYRYLHYIRTGEWANENCENTDHD